MWSEGNAWRNGEPAVGLFFNNAPVQWLDLVKDFLAKGNVTTLQQHPYFPVLALALAATSMVLLWCY